MSVSVGRVFELVVAARGTDPSASRTAKLLGAGRAKMAKKLAEEAAEVIIDAMAGERDAVVRESADLLYNLVVLWSELGIAPQDVWDEMARRERLFGLAEKLPKKVKAKLPEPAARRKVVMLASRRAPKRR
jgi:phosphoribosyl-ATP pyrophosphohydrolase